VNRYLRITFCHAIAVLLVAPLTFSDRYANLAIRILVAALFATAFNLLWRQERLLSFGHGVYFGRGMFAVVHLTRANEAGLSVPLILVPLAGVLSGLFIGLLCGFVATLRSGAYFSMITLVRKKATCVARGPHAVPQLLCQRTGDDSQPGSFLQRGADAVKVEGAPNASTWFAQGRS